MRTRPVAIPHCCPSLCPLSTKGGKEGDSDPWNPFVCVCVGGALGLLAMEGTEGRAISSSHGQSRGKQEQEEEED